MSGTVSVYIIYWLPSSFPSTVDPYYISLIDRYYSDVGGNQLYNLLSQYPGYTGTPGSATFASSDSWVDTAAYPFSCSQPPCTLSQSDIEGEVNHAIATNGWSAGGWTNYFVVYTDPGVQSSVGGCGYHNYIASSNDIIYGYIPYPDSQYLHNCLLKVENNLVSPNVCLSCDDAISWSAHEQFEAATDPLTYISSQGAWYAPNQTPEIGDECEGQWGNLMDNDQANQLWNNHYYIIQEMWSNNQGGCSQGE
jgi:hypothetical protein